MNWNEKLEKSNFSPTVEKQIRKETNKIIYIKEIDRMNQEADRIAALEKSKRP